MPIGRPAKHWRLTPESDRLFPDAYAELNVALLDAVGSAFGPAGLQRVLESREAKQRAEYVRRIAPSAPLKERLQQLASVRTDEGYMAEVGKMSETVSASVKDSVNPLNERVTAMVERLQAAR